MIGFNFSGSCCKFTTAHAAKVCTLNCNTCHSWLVSVIVIWTCCRLLSNCWDTWRFNSKDDVTSLKTVVTYWKREIKIINDINPKTVHKILKGWPDSKLSVSLWSFTISSVILVFDRLKSKKTQLYFILILALHSLRKTQYLEKNRTVTTWFIGQWFPFWWR